MIIHNPILTGSFTVNGTDVASITSSAASITAINAYTASQDIRNGTYATTGSNTFKNPQTINSNLIVTGSITAATLVVQTITSSVIYSSGSNVFGNNIANTQVMTGSVTVTGSLAVVTNGTELQVTSTGVRIGNISTDTHPITGSVNVSGSAAFSGSVTAANAEFINGGQDGALGSAVRISTTNTNALARNWAIVNTWDNYGDLTFRVSNAQGGNAISAGATRMVILSGGNVLIGHTTESTYKLDIRSSSGNNFVQSYTQITTNGQQCGFVANSLWSGSERGVTWAMFKHGSITNPATYISFWSGTSTFQYMHMDDSGVLRLSSNSGDIGTANGTIVGTQTSDIRLKNVKESFNYGLNEILQINPIAFTFKNDINNTDKLGFSAQEMLNIIPESVYDTNNCIDGYNDTDDSMIKIPKSNNNIYGMDYTTLIPVLVKAIQELKSQNDDLQAQITELKNK